MYELVRAFHPRGCLTLLASTHHMFFHVMQPCDSIGHRPMVPSSPIIHQVWWLIIIMHSHPFIMMSPCICNVMHHCMLYHATYIMNVTRAIHTIQFTMYYGQLYYEHIISKPTIISMSIYSNTYINIQLPLSISSKTQAMTTLIHKTNCDIDIPTKQSTQWPQGKP